MYRMECKKKDGTIGNQSNRILKGSREAHHYTLTCQEVKLPRSTWCSFRIGGLLAKLSDTQSMNTLIPRREFRKL